MNVLVEPSGIKGSIIAPSSKSHFQRVIAVASLSRETTIIGFNTLCNDTLAALDIARSLGAEVQLSDNIIQIAGYRNSLSRVWKCMESGLSLRMFAPIAALFDEKIVLNATGTLKNRPIDFLESTFDNFGIEFQSGNGYAPLEVIGTIQAGNYTIDGSKSSQHVSGFLIALSFCQGKSVVKIENPTSLPYILMTMDVLKQFGISIQQKENFCFEIDGNSKAKSSEIEIEGDWSGAAFFFAAGINSGIVEISGLNIESKQADEIVFNFLKMIGADIQILNNKILIKKSKLRRFEFDAKNCPDLFPVLAVLASNIKGYSRISGVHRLRHKESDRLESIMQILIDFGIEVFVEDDTMVIYGGKIKGAKLDSFNDHRIVMMASVMALNASSAVEISNAEAVDKSYPDFFFDLKKLFSY